MNEMDKKKITTKLKKENQARGIMCGKKYHCVWDQINK